MTPEMIAAFAGVLVAWLEFHSEKSSRDLRERLALVEHRLSILENCND